MLYHRLRSARHDVEHIIVLGQRGIKDREILKRLEAEEIIFLTQDSEFLDRPTGYPGAVIVSSVRQAMAIQDRVQIWAAAIEGFLARRPTGKLFELLETGEIVAWETHETN